MTLDDESNQPLTAFEHLPVMVDDVVALFAEVPPGVVLDATVGGGGHSAAILESRTDLSILGIDQDPAALRATADRLGPYEDRVRLVHCRFDRVGQALEEASVSSLSGFLFDLGVSSPQLDWAGRGFSFRHDGPLDMRMNPESPTTADSVVNGYEVGELEKMLRRNSDERFAYRIAQAVVAARPLRSTAQLAEVVRSAIPAAARRTGGHPAKRAFQAIRIEVNEELDVLRPGLDKALDVLAPGGKGLVLTYHSGEDRIVKDVFRAHTQSPDPPGLPVEQTPANYSLVRPVARQPQPQELQRNPRASSARLRAVTRTGAADRP